MTAAFLLFCPSDPGVSSFSLRIFWYTDTVEDKEPPSPPSQAPVSDEEGGAASDFSDMIVDGAVGGGFSDGGGCEAFM